MNIILFGMPLSGKTTIGQIISKKLNLKWIDLDREIEKLHGDTISNIYTNLKEEKFRELEHKCLENIYRGDKHVLSSGGGAVNPINSNIISSYSNRVWLKCSIDGIINRHNLTRVKRPLLYNTNNLDDTLNQLYHLRRPLFADLSNIEIDTTDLDHNQITRDIIIRINEIN